MCDAHRELAGVPAWTCYNGQARVDGMWNLTGLIPDGGFIRRPWASSTCVHVLLSHDQGRKAGGDLCSAMQFLLWPAWHCYALC
jgi:hypothetical protein